MKFFNEYIHNGHIDNRFYKKQYSLNETHILLYNLLYIFDKFVKSYNIKYWLDFGTLLGAYRHKKIIPWDNDIDVGILFNDLLKLPNNTLIQNRYLFEKNKYYNNKCDNDNTVAARLIDTNNGLFIDIFAYFISDNSIYLNCNTYKQQLINDVFPLKLIIFNNKYYNCPNNITKYLNKYYNNDLSIPDEYCNFNLEI